MNNHFSPQTIEHEKKTMTSGIGNQDPDLDRHKNVVGFNQFIFKMAVQSFDL